MIYSISPLTKIHAKFNITANHIASLVSTDEVGALVFDIGSYSVRAGYAGEDCPKVSGSLE